MESVVLCIGNPDGGDDGVGTYIAHCLQIQDTNFTVIDCGTNPENFTSIVKQKKPIQVVLIDAVDMSLPPGNIRVVPKEKIGVMHVSTHGIPLSVLIKYLEEFVPKVVVIGIQPKTMDGSLTSTVQKSADKLIQILAENRIQEIPTL